MYLKVISSLLLLSAYELIADETKCFKIEELTQQSEPQLDLFWEEIGQIGTPLIEPIAGTDNYLVTFLSRESAVVIGMGTPFKASDHQMENIAGTDVWYKSYVVPKGSEISYKLSFSDPSSLAFDDYHISLEEFSKSWCEDPFNQNEGTAACGKIDKKSDIRETTDSGTLKKERFSSHYLENERDIWVYTPYGYKKEKQKGYPLVVVLNTTIPPSVAFLDQLIQKESLAPSIVCFVGSSDNNTKELGCDPLYSRFIAHELTPWIRLNWKVTSHPSKTVIAGSNYAGMTAAFLALKNPTVFGKVLAQSPWLSWKSDLYPEGIAKLYEKCAKLPIQFYLSSGLFEEESKHVDQFKLTLEKKGYSVRSQEFLNNSLYGLSSDLLWKASLQEGLPSLLGRAIKPLEDI